MKRLTATGGKVLVVSSGVALAGAIVLLGDTRGPTADGAPSSAAADMPSPSTAATSKAEVARRAPAGAAPSTSSAAGAAAAAPADPIDCAFTIGQRASYAFEGRDDAEVDPSGFGLPFAGQGQLTKVESGYAGQLDTLVLSSDEGGAVVLSRLSGFQSTAVREDRALEAPFLVRIAQDCSVQGFAHDATLDAGYARIQQALMHDLSFVTPSLPLARFEGTDALGALEGEVEHATRGGRAVIVKRAQRLEPWQKGIGSLRDVESFSAVVAPSRSGWFESFELAARYSGVGITSTRSLEARRLDELGSLDGASRDLGGYVWTDLLTTQAPLREATPPSQRELDARAAVQGYEVGDVLDRLVERVGTEGVGVQQTWPELQTYMEARPETARVIAGRLINDEIPAQATMATFIALGNTRTTQARDALLGIARSPSNSSFDRTRAIFSLVDRADVGDGFASELAALAAPMLTTRDEQEHLLARHALLALGMFSGLNPGRDDIKQVAVGAIRGVLAQAPNSIMASPAYGAFSNIGDHALLPMIADVIDHPDYSTREVAALATRRMDPSETAEFTRRWLEKEQDWRVKLTLYHNLELQTFEARETTSRAVLELALEDLKRGPGVLTRKALVRLLGRASSRMDRDDELRQEIERQFTSMIRFELDNRTGLYMPLTEHLDPILIREGIAGEPFEAPPAGGVDARTDLIKMRPIQ